MVKNLKFILLFYFAILISGCDVFSEFETVNIGNVKLKIEKNKVISSDSSMFGSIVGLDDTQSILLHFTYSDVNVEAGPANKRIEYVSVLVSKLSDNVLYTGYGEDVNNAWYGKKIYAEREIVKDETLGLYKIYSKIKYPIAWHLFNNSPLKQTSIAGSWVAGCRSVSLDGPNADWSNVRCRSTRVYKDLMLDIKFDGNYFRHIHEINNGVIEYIASHEKIER